MGDTIEVGEYVKTKDGIIAQIKSIDYEAGIYRFDRIIYNNDFGMKEDVLYNNEMFKKLIVKHRKQLIDLIEVGDIVNKELVIGIIDITNNKEEIIGKKLITQYRSAQFTGLDIKHYIYANDIKTILTKEQYTANCYKVGGEDE